MKKFTKISSLILAALMMASALAACGGDTDNDGKDTGSSTVATTAPAADENNYEKDKAEYDSMTAEQLVEKYVADPANITPEEYCNLIATYAFVPIADDGEFEYDNKTKEAINIVKDAGSKLPSGLDDTVSKTMTSHPYEFARAYYYRTMASSGAGEGTAAYNNLLAQYKNETDPYVIGCMIYGCSYSLGVNAEYCEYVLSLIDSEEYTIRFYVALQLDKLEAADKEALVSAGLKLMEDSDEEIRKSAMLSCGTIADERFVEPLSAVLKDETQINCHSDAASALVSMWYGKVSEAAYNATMDYFKAEYTSSKHPDWVAMNKIASILPNEAKWRPEATYFNERDLVAVMTDVVADAEAQKLSKTTAVKIIGKYGTADDLDALKPLVETSADKDAIISEIDKQLEKIG